MPHERTLLVIDATRPGGVSGALVSRWFTDRAVADGRAKVDTVGVDEPEEVFAARLVGADAVAVVTPEYNHSFPGPLKVAIDRFRTSWFTLPVGFVTHGGRSGGLRAAEQLRLVFAELHAVTIRETISFVDAREAFDETGVPRDPGLEFAHERFLDVLYWWSDAVGAGHRLRAYPVA